MVEGDKREFAEIMGAVMALYGRDATQPLLRLYFAALGAHSLEHVRQALDRWVKDPEHGQFMPKPAEIIRTIEYTHGSSRARWLSANEAWAQAIPAADESATVVWTPETAKAWEVARPLFEAGDKVGARMAFLPAYERLVEQARIEGKEPHFEVSAGWDPKMRLAAVEKARTIGLLPPARPEPVLAIEGPAGEEFTPEQLEANRERMAANLRQLAENLAERAEQNEKDRIEAAARARQQFEDRKAAMVAEAEAHFAKDEKPDDAAPVPEAAE
ncbi:hypothetical protein PEp14_00054 [Erwinia phage PEp14]|uniref:Uncharacterized protein n=1 Tax=Erwinia phage PEp14 TaxID=1131315 RepID=H2DE84_9CAUD|nr:hypothetical protein PEp14_00054 [Erwinia phage PEp14]AEY69643.1 hypothetical protein PEp14_00054 [Erwinia phage PEp14]